MKLWQIVGGAAALTITLAGCAQKSADVPTQAAANADSGPGGDRFG